MRNLIWYLLVFGFVLNTGVLAQPEMDTTFAGTGKTLISNGSQTYASDIAIQSDNRIIMVSGCWNFDLLQVPFCSIRVNENGSLDHTFKAGHPFSNQGGVYTRFSGASGGALGVALQNDGKVVVVGFATSGNDNVALVRYQGADGSLDATFGTAGIVFTDVTPGSNDRAQKVAIQPDGKIVIVGYSGNDQILARYLSDGTLDSSFGTGGIARTTISGSAVKGSVLEIMHDGRIVAGGSHSNNTLVLTRFNSDGSPDTTWDGDGVLTVPGPWNSLSIAVMIDGRVVVLSYPKSIYRFNTDGSPDITFDGDGVHTAALPASDSQVYDMAVSASGRITVVGSHPMTLHSGGPWWTYRTAKYLSNGSPDTSYSGDGYLDFDIGTFHNDGATVVAFDTVGRTVIGGLSASGSAAVPFEHPIYSAARLSAPSVTTVTISGRVTGPNGNGVSNATVSTQGVSTRTTPFGFYTLSVLTNQTYTVSVRAKNDLAFNKRTLLVDAEITDLDFVGQLFEMGRSK